MAASLDTTRPDRPEHGFLGTFVEPLVAGDPVLVGLPLDRPQLDAWLAEVETRSAPLLELELRLQRQANGLLPRPPMLHLDRNAALLVAGLHQVAFACHGAVDRSQVTVRRLAALSADTARLLSDVPAPASPAEILLAHLLISPALRLYRRDVTVIFGVGSKRFYGEEVRWLRMPFRWRVMLEETVGTDVLEATLGRATAPVLLHLLRLSPLTRLLNAQRLHEHFDFSGMGLVFADQALCRLAVHQVVERGLAESLPAWASALECLLRDGITSREDALQVARFIVTCALSQEEWRPYRDQQAMFTARYAPPTQAVRFETPSVGEERARAGETDATVRARLLRRGWAMVRTLLARPELLGLPENDRSSRTCARLVKRLQTVASTLGPDGEEIERLVEQALAA